jgi:hypothetical protein
MWICCKRQYYYDFSNRLQLKILDEQAIFEIGDTLDIDIEITNISNKNIDIRIINRAFSLLIHDTSRFIYSRKWFIGTDEEEFPRELMLKSNEKRNIQISLLGDSSMLFPGEFDFDLFLHFDDQLDNQKGTYKALSLNRINIKIID